MISRNLPITRFFLTILLSAVILSMCHFPNAAGAQEAIETGSDWRALTLEDLDEPRTTAKSRAAFLDDLRQKGIRQTLETTKPTPETEDAWRKAFWGAAFLLQRDPTVKDGIGRALRVFHDEEFSDEFRRRTLEAVYSLYPVEFVNEVAEVIIKIDQPKLFAMAVEYLWRAGYLGTDREPWPVPEKWLDNALEAMRRKFPHWQDSSILTALHFRLTTDLEEALAERPPLSDLLAHDFGQGAVVVFSLQRLNRRHPGLAIVRRTDGTFVRDAKGEIFAIPQLALSMSDLPGYITNGNTPQGLFTLVGTGTASNQFIGKTPYLHLKLPYEADPAEFFHDQNLKGRGWQEEMYLNALPDSWRDYKPMLMAWWAGAAGRTEILAHGTTIDQSFHEGEPYYPQTPSVGCLCVREVWSPETGKALESDQLALLHAYRDAGGGTGYYVVVEVDNEASPVSLSEATAAILEAEGSSHREPGRSE